MLCNYLNHILPFLFLLVFFLFLFLFFCLFVCLFFWFLFLFLISYLFFNNFILMVIPISYLKILFLIVCYKYLQITKNNISNILIFKKIPFICENWIAEECENALRVVNVLTNVNMNSMNIIFLLWGKTRRCQTSSYGNINMDIEKQGVLQQHTYKLAWQLEKCNTVTNITTWRAITGVQSRSS